MARFSTKSCKLLLIQCYAPTEQATTDEKDSFYEALENTLRNAKRSEITMVIGDLNTKVGADNKNFEHAMGRHGLGNMNENGERFAELCSNNNLYIRGTLFPHKQIHKATWVSPDQTMQNQIDHIVIHKEWRRSLFDVRAFRGADTASDHQLLIGSVQLKIAALKVRDIVDRLKFNIDKLKSKMVHKNLEKEIEKITQRTQKANESTEKKWHSIRTALLEASEEILGRRKISRKDWISDDTWGSIANRKEIKGKLLNADNETEKTSLRRQYWEANKSVKKAARKDKRIWAENLAQAPQNAADLKNPHDLYRFTRQLAKKSFINATSTVTGKDVKQLTAVEEQVQIWQEHFGEILSTPAQEHKHEVNTTKHPLVINENPPPSTQK